MNKPKLTTHRVTMPQDKALEYLDELLNMVNKQFLDPGFPIALSMAIDKMRTPSPENKALTVELCYYRGKVDPLTNAPYIHTGCRHSLDFRTDLSEWRTCPFCGRQKQEDGNDVGCRPPEKGE